ncbi:hypothetical protein Q0590_36145 [Rhodocytophaga aerolata]|uniref:DUF3575 domain-containing protein n=1 Tax=Rhodocytophaga aerolata TaxID=455078 RepID=A0ABT8RI24_9BACT|nr:hypothetical protein [Rhodocytophaga aerolata]MDO1451762.1 hypothetical protein [Rhodocytophaga aerolata]
MFKQTLLTLLLLLGAFIEVNAQEVRKSMQKNTLFVEIGGNGFFYSLNYDRILLDYSTWRISARIGGMYMPGIFETNRHLIGLPLEVSYWRGKGNHHFELGLGFTPIYDTYSLNEVSRQQAILIGVARIGYRYQKREGGVFYRAGFMPLHGTIYDFNYRQWDRNSNFTYPLVGLAIGYTLKR